MSDGIVQELSGLADARAGRLAASPVAWGVLRVGGRMMAILDDVEQAESLCERLNQMENWPHEIVPLYTSPTLTDAERDAVETAALEADAHQHTIRAATLRGLLERHFPAPENPPARDNSPRDNDSLQIVNDAPDLHSNQSEVSVPWMARPFYVDPAEGWAYGFPRLYDPATDGNMTEWLVANGYPKHLADQNLPCTFTAQIDSQ